MVLIAKSSYFAFLLSMTVYNLIKQIYTENKNSVLMNIYSVLECNLTKSN